MGVIQNAKVNKAIKMAAGQLDGILKMIVQKRDSVEVSDQLQAIPALIRGCQMDIFKDELTSYIEDIVATPNAKDRKNKIDKLIVFIDRILK